MGEFFMNFATFLGGVGGILIGVLFLGVVIGVGLLPILFINRPNELDAFVDPAAHESGKRLETRPPSRPVRT